jgi:FKBP-type peptidyl-prolyl cis-trans isomerase 2
LKAKTGDLVKVHYSLKDAKGNVVESSRDLAPIEFTIGENKVIPGFEKAITGMAPGETTTAVIPPEDAYGPRDDKKIFEYEKSKVPGDFSPRVGDTVKMHRPDGNALPVTVIAATDKSYTMDANHPLAGKELTFDLELLEITKSTPSKD